jgi:hypothetical protein
MISRETAAVVFSILAALPLAVAQSPPPNASPGVSAVAPSRDGMRPPIGASHDAATDADARLCLEFPTNLQVIMCAEKYRPHKRNA